MNKNNNSVAMGKRLPLLAMNELVDTADPGAPKADLTNANHLMGDIYDDSGYGDADYGDPDGNYGDALYGDVDTSALNTYNTLVGDASEQGAPFRPLKNWTRGQKTALGIGVGAAATTGIALLVKKKIEQQKRIKASLRSSDQSNTIANQVRARRLMGKIPRTAAMPFYQMIGATLNGYPLSPTEVFAGDTLKYNFDRQSTDTPFEVEIVNGTFAGITWTLTANGVATNRYYTAVFVTIGISVLTANPGTIFSITGTLPTINGSLVISSNPFSFTIRPGYYAKFLIFPWQLVTNKPLLALGQYSLAAPITLNIVGLPSNASVSMVVPGSQHPWTIAMRNRLI